MRELRQSTAITEKIGPFVDDADGYTPEVALVITQAEVRLTKNGGNYAQKNDAGAAAHDEDGWYDCDLNAADTGTLGHLRLAVYEAGALPVWHDFMVITQDYWDAKYANGLSDIADEVLNRDLGTAPDTNPRTLLQAARFLRNKWDIIAGVLSVREENDVAVAWTANVTQAAGNPVTGIDPV